MNYFAFQDRNNALASLKEARSRIDKVLATPPDKLSRDDVALTRLVLRDALTNLQHWEEAMPPT